MPMSNTVVYRDLDSSSALTETIDKKLKKLNRYFDNISSSRVVLDTRQRTTAHGNDSKQHGQH